MIEQFYNFNSIISALLKILLLFAVGFVLYSKELIKNEGIEALNNLLLWVMLPALMISRITSTFEPGLFAYWWLLPFWSIIISVIGLLIGYLVSRPFRNFTAKREFASSCAFQNSGYLPMTLVAFVCSGEFCDILLVYIFLFLIGYNIGMWIVLPIFLTRGEKRKFSIKAAINPPLVATLFSLSVVFIAGKGCLPGLIYDPLKLLGDTTFPLALIMLGGYLAKYKGHRPDNWPAVAACVLAKLFIIPLVMLLIIVLTIDEPDYRFFLFLESIMPVAVSLVIIGQYKQADNKFFSGVIFYSHVLALVTLPFWLWLYKHIQ